MQPLMASRDASGVKIRRGGSLRRVACGTPLLAIPTQATPLAWLLEKARDPREATGVQLGALHSQN